MCGCSVARAEMTSPNALRDLLMAWASFRFSPVEPLFFTLCVYVRVCMCECVCVCVCLALCMGSTVSVRC